mmetsp:Transcript_6595/g.19020  ORF Transcript_6595/g.19020 Transcript_6595/m.19020 type:complete len:539 (+) Transcript_6595:222-1838(+)
MQTAATTNMQPCLGGLTINIVFAYKITALNELKMPSNMPAAAVLPTGSVHRERHIDGWTAALQKAVAIRTHTSAWKGRARKTLPARPNRLLRGRCSSICREMAPTPEMFPAQYDVEYHLPQTPVHVIVATGICPHLQGRHRRPMTPVPQQINIRVLRCTLSVPGIALIVDVVQQQIRRQGISGHGVEVHERRVWRLLRSCPSLLSRPLPHHLIASLVGLHKLRVIVSGLGGYPHINEVDTASCKPLQIREVVGRHFPPLLEVAHPRYQHHPLPREHGGEVGLQVAALRLEAGCMDEVSGERRLLASTWPAGAPAQPPEEGGHQRPLDRDNDASYLCIVSIPLDRQHIALPAHRVAGVGEDAVVDHRALLPQQCHQPSPQLVHHAVARNHDPHSCCRQPLQHFAAGILEVRAVCGRDGLPDAALCVSFRPHKFARGVPSAAPSLACRQQSAFLVYPRSFATAIAVGGWHSFMASRRGKRALLRCCVERAFWQLAACGCYQRLIAVAVPETFLRNKSSACGWLVARLEEDDQQRPNGDTQ